MQDFNRGLRHAEVLMAREPERLEYWIERVNRGKRRWTTLLFNSRKRRFLAGLQTGLEGFRELQLKELEPKPTEVEA